MRIKNKISNFKILNSKLQKLFFGICIFLIGISANAQCAMCRAALAGDSNTKKAEAVNDGIVYLMVIPYLLVGIIGFLIYRMYQSKKKKAV
ncbi:hypothetical protein ACQ9BO_06295 [Flavobacterium sp. P21]|uniref:hypothetical protein n=1 Tax=Flavobacterium sp. P21 TaxID=3423948 RepID=UPI003D67EBE4